MPTSAPTADPPNLCGEETLDPLLVPYTQAPTEAEATAQLDRLIAHVDPVLRAILDGENAMGVVPPERVQRFTLQNGEVQLPWSPSYWLLAPRGYRTSPRIGTRAVLDVVATTQLSVLSNE